MTASQIPNEGRAPHSIPVAPMKKLLGGFENS